MIESKDVVKFRQKPMRQSWGAKLLQLRCWSFQSVAVRRSVAGIRRVHWWAKGRSLKHQGTGSVVIEAPAAAQRFLRERTEVTSDDTFNSCMFHSDSFSPSRLRYYSTPRRTKFCTI